MLKQLFQVPLTDPPDGAAVALSDITTPMGVKDVVYVLGGHGLLTAFDGATGMTIWKATFGGAGNSAPAIDPNRRYIYANCSDGIHKLQVGDGTEVKTGGWPIANGGGKPSGQLAIGTDNMGVSYLYAQNNGHGHTTIVNLASGTTHVFNLACSNQPDTQTPTGCDAGANPWARSAVFLPELQKVFVGTGTNDGSGKWVAGQIWRTSWVALPPDGHTTMMGGGGYPADSYTPANWAAVVGRDADSSVGGFIPLPVGYSSKYPHLAIQPGKDTNIRILNAADLSGQGAPGKLGGELGQYPGNMGLLRAWGAIWVNPADKVAWVFVGGGNGLASFTVDLDPTGAPKLTPHWTIRNGWTTAPFMANGVLYATNNAGEHTNNANPHLIQAIDPASGKVLWSAPVGQHHWSSPIMINGVLYLADGPAGGFGMGPSHLTAWSIK
jgi:hypothetical protein